MSVVWLASLNAPAAQLLFDNFSSTNTSMWGYSNTGGAALSITNGNLFPRTTTTGANQRALVASISNNFNFFTTPMSITLDVTSVSGGNAGGTNVFADRYVMITTGGGAERNYINGSAGASVFASIARNGGTNLLQVGMIGTNGNFYTSQTAYSGDLTQMVVTFNSAGYSITGSGTNGFALSGGDITTLWGTNIQFIAATNWNANGFRLTTGVSNRGNQNTTNSAQYNQIEVNSLPYTINSNNITFNPATNESISYNWAITGSNSLIVNGAGTVTIGGTNSFTGGTTVNGGKLIVNGTLGTNSAVTVANGGALGGSGSAGTTTIQSGGTIAPGNSPGTLSITGNLVWNSGANYDWEILNLADAPGTNWDLINVSGALDLTNIAGPFNINLYTLSGTNTFGSLAGFTSTASYAWKILAAGTAIGSFSTNKFTINTANFVNDISGGLFALELRNDNKDLYLTYSGSPIPEPGTWTAAALLAGMAGFMRWRNRRRIAD